MSFEQHADRISITGAVESPQPNVRSYSQEGVPIEIRPEALESPMIEMHTAAVQTSFNGSCSSETNKRRRVEDSYFEDVSMISPGRHGYHPGAHPEVRNVVSGKRFIHIRRSGYVYHSEEWKPRGATMYLPLLEDIMINTHSIDQISFEADQFFLADEKGNYVGAKSGHAMHLWRFDNTNKKIYISRSILFVREHDHKELRMQLEYL